MLKEFKTFIMRGNIVDLAVAVVIGAAFTAIVNSLVADIITPLLLTPIMNFLNVQDLEKVMWHNIKYGKFLAAVINFIIVGFVLFLIIKGMNKMTKKNEVPAPPPVPTQEEILLTQIRDLLKEKNN